MIKVHTASTCPEELVVPDVYFRAGYGEAAENQDGGEWVLLEGFDGMWQLPLILRDTNEGLHDGISPYGYSGVFAAETLTLRDIRAAWRGTMSALKELDVLSIFLRHSPLVAQSPAQTTYRPIVTNHPTILIEFTDCDTLWAGMAGRCRTAIRKAIRLGYTAEVRHATPRDLAVGNEFRTLYEQTMRQRSAAASYFFTDRYYSALLHGLGDALLIAEIRDSDGNVASSALLLRDASFLHYHLSGSSTTGARMGANNFLLWSAARFGVNEGLQSLHLGGGVAPRDSLFRFKQSFGGRELNYSASGLVVDSEGYLSAVRRRAAESSIPAQKLLSSTYFPAYRANLCDD